MSGVLAMAGILALLQSDSIRTRMVDPFDDVTPWTAHPADGVTMKLSSVAGYKGRALRLDFSFGKSGGYAVARRQLPLDLPPNYEFTLWIKGDAPPNTLEFKLVDSTGENVWWYTEPNRIFNETWQRVTIRQRQISFAWGPARGGVLRRAAALELVITKGKGGGSGSVWFDELTLTEQPVVAPYDLTPAASSRSEQPGFPAGAAIDGDPRTAWRSAAGGPVKLVIDFGHRREFGGATLIWEPGRAAVDYDLLLSDDGLAWRTAQRVRKSDGGRDHLLLPDGESRFMMLSLLRPEGAAAYGLLELMVRSLEFGSTRNAFFETIARESTPGAYPRYFLDERSYWTVVGADGAAEEGLINMDGAVDAGPGAFSVEPFIWLDSLYTWRESSRKVWLEQDDLPIPSVRWDPKGIELTITAFGAGTADRSSLIIRYRLVNRGTSALRPTLYLAIQPFQVNPPWQFLGVPGGAALVDSVRWTGSEIRVNGDRRVIPLVEPGAVGVTAFGGGGIVEHLLKGRLPSGHEARDPLRAASAALAYPVSLGPGDSTEVALEIPMTPGGKSILTQRNLAAARTAMAETAKHWRELVDRVTISLPGGGETITRTMKSTIAWILINRDRAAIQPGSRSYERSWIRDGSLTSTAMLRFGHPEVVREFIDWYAGYQYPNGKIPCCVDRRGADPVPEHDSPGEFIYLVMEYWRHTGDRALLERMWPHVAGAVHYIDSLRQTERTAEYQATDKRVFFGLLPPSISHEGYSAQPMHSYWDDFFALRGLKDAAQMAAVLGRADEARRIGAMRDEFRGDLLASLNQAMQRYHINYLPGSADLGDFDPTSTTIAVSPVGEEDKLPRAALDSTFERYWTEVSARRDSTLQWEAYAPYELRSVGVMLRLGWKDRALSLLGMFLGDREPPEWNQWPEVVWKDRHADKFIGDSPHTWVGSDFLRSAADLFAYEREADSALVVAAGLAEDWLKGSGIAVSGLHTWWGPLSYRAQLEGNSVKLTVDAGLRVPSGGLVVRTPGSQKARQARLNGETVRMTGTGEVVIRQLPAELVFVR